MVWNYHGFKGLEKDNAKISGTAVTGSPRFFIALPHQTRLQILMVEHIAQAWRTWSTPEKKHFTFY
jgi:hypothetical protein